MSQSPAAALLHLASSDHDHATQATRDLLAAAGTVSAHAAEVRRAALLTAQCHTDATTHARVDQDTRDRIRDLSARAEVLATAADQLDDAIAALRDAHQTQHDTVDVHRARRNACTLCGFSEYDHPRVDAAHPFTPKD